MVLDHLILTVNDIDASARFYVEALGFTDEGLDGPFTKLRVSPELTFQLAPWGSNGGDHLAFAMSASEFDEVFERLRNMGIKYGDSFHAADNMQGPGEEGGARGMGAALYFFDPNQHLIEIRHYEGR